MNIEKIKKKVNEVYYDGPVQDEIFFLLSIIKQAEKALNDIADSKYITIVTVRKLAEEALQAIRK